MKYVVNSIRKPLGCKYDVKNLEVRLLSASVDLIYITSRVITCTDC